MAHGQPPGGPVTDLGRPGLGWLPFSVAEPLLQTGALLRIPLCNISNGTQLFVDWVWSKERPLGLAARRFVEQLQVPVRLEPR